MQDIEEIALSEEEQQFYNALDIKFGKYSMTDDFKKRLVRAFHHQKSSDKRLEMTLSEAKRILNWRMRLGVDTILKTSLPLTNAFETAWPCYFYGEDDSGHLLTLDSVSTINVDILQKELTSIEQLLLHRVQFMERLQWEKEAISIRRGYRVTKHISVVDLKGFGLRFLSPTLLTHLKPIFEIGQSYYPETLHCMYLVNAPYIFTSAWKIIAAFVNAETKEKMHVLRNSEEFVKLAVSHKIPIESIPIQLGGTHAGTCVDQAFKPSIPDAPLPVAPEPISNSIE